MLNDVLALLVEAQTWINQRVVGDLRSFSETRSIVSLATVLPMGVLFGAVHALTPGHSKTVLASYLAGSPFSMIKGIGIAAVLSLTHVLMAVMIALLALPLVKTTLHGVGRAPLLDDLSRGLIAALGAWMVFRALFSRPHRHEAGPWFGVAAGLIPCPLTLFAMVFAISRGIPEAGLVFAGAMMIGVGITLAGVAVLTILARDTLSATLARHGRVFATTGRWLEFAAGAALVAIGLRELFPT